MRSIHVLKALSFGLGVAAAAMAVGCGSSESSDCAATSTCAGPEDGGIDVSSVDASSDGKTSGGGSTGDASVQREAAASADASSDVSDSSNDVPFDSILADQGVDQYADQTSEERGDGGTDAMDARPLLQCDGSAAVCGDKCVDYLTDYNNCGACGTACAGVQECSKGKCCSQSFTNCGGTCADLKTDPLNCGQCGAPCAAQQTCSDGKCCPTGQTNCGGTCVNLKTDKAHCGVCTTQCNATVPNGSFVCNGGNCEAKCDDGKDLCGSTCCGAPPLNSAVTCDSQVCTPHCLGTTLSCTAGARACGSWNFESGTTEGWALDPLFAGPANGVLPVASTASHSEGSSSLAINWQVPEGSIDTILVVRVPLCGGTFASEGGHKVSLKLRLDGGPAVISGRAALTWWTQTAPGSASLTTTDLADNAEWQTVDMGTYMLPYDPLSYLGLSIHLSAPWTGKIYIDDVQIQ